MIRSLRRFMGGLGVIALLCTATATITAAPTYAADTFKSGDGCTATFLTFPAWYDGLPRDGCAIQSPQGDSDAVGGFVWLIVLNIIEIVLQLIGYAAAGFIIFGGFKYVTSVSSADKSAAARKTILNAIIGLAISFLSVVIVNLISGNIQANP